MTEKFARRLFSARLHVLVHAAPRADYFDCGEPVKRHSVDEFAGKFADVSRGGGWRRGAAHDSESKSDDGKSSPHAGKRSTARYAEEMSHTRRRTSRSSLQTRNAYATIPLPCDARLRCGRRLRTRLAILFRPSADPRLHQHCIQRATECVSDRPTAVVAHCVP